MTESTQALRIGNGADWHFVNAPWHDGENNELCVPEHPNDDDYSIQGHEYAIKRELCCRDVRVKFEFRLVPHSEVGIILRAQSPREFYLLHFPDCGQASRAQHFWVALSRMDANGFLKCIKLEMVRRVPSVPRDWMAADVILRGAHVSVKLAEHGYFEAHDHALQGPGRVGVFQTNIYRGAGIRNVVVDADPAACVPWADAARQPTNWFHPILGVNPRAEDNDPSHNPHQVVQFPDGELLLFYSEHQGLGDDLITYDRLARSHDGGRRWSEPEVYGAFQDGDDWARPQMHLTPAGRLIAIMRGPDQYYTVESIDRGRSWEVPLPAGIPLSLPNLPALHMGPAVFTNCRNGEILIFLHGGYDLKDPELHHLTYGGAHCQAFSSHSSDDGRTWSAPVNLDNMGSQDDQHHKFRAIDGNLDLTEACGAEMDDGHIMALIRPPYSPWMWETWSRDHGRTWGPCMRGPFPGYATPNMLRTTSGAVLVAHRLPSMTLNVSRDNGHTWDQGTQIDSGGWCMGCMVEVEPDVVLYLYLDSNPRPGRMRGQHLRVTATGLEPIPPV
jgi:hypothetical protein